MNLADIPPEKRIAVVLDQMARACQDAKDAALKKDLRRMCSKVEAAIALISPLVDSLKILEDEELKGMVFKRLRELESEN